MRQTGLFALFGVTILAAAAAVAVSLGSAGNKTDPLAGRPVLDGLATRLDQVAHIAIVHGESKTTLTHQNGAWVVEEKNGYPADAAKTRRVLLGLAALSYAEPKTTKPDLYSRLDLDDPAKKGSDARLVTLSDDKNQLMGELIVGKRRYDIFGGGNDGVYVRKPGDQRTWLAAGSLDLPSETIDWLDRKITEIPGDKIKSVAFSGADGGKFAISRAKPGDAFAVAGGLPAGTKLKSEDSLNDLARALAYLDLDDVKPAAAVAFPDKGTAQAVFTTFDGVGLTVTVMDQDDPKAKPEDKDKKKLHWAMIAAAGTGAAAKEADALNKRFGGWAYQIPEFKAQSFETKLTDLTEPAKSS